KGSAVTGSLLQRMVYPLKWLTSVPLVGPLAGWLHERMYSEAEYPMVAVKYGIGDTLMALAGKFLPSGDGQGENRAKQLSGLLGQANSAAWFVAGEENNAEIVAHLRQALDGAAAGEEGK